MPWQPLLASERRDAALRVAREIAAALTDPPSCWVPPGAQQQLIRVANSTLGGGRAGIALFFGYLAHSDQESASYASLARDFVGETVRAASTELMGPSLFGGFAGIGWTLARLHDWGVVACDEATFEPIDEALLSFVDRQPWPWQIDLISGVTGIAVYALDRLPRPSAVRTLELIVDTLESSAEKNDQGITWFTPPHLLQPESLREAPHGYYNFGLAHGVPGIISILTDILAAGIEADRATRLIEGAVAWLLAEQMEGTQNFPYMTGPEVVTKPSRIGWCYGAPGIAVALCKAAGVLDRDDWRTAALRIADWAVEQPAEATGVADAGFCHGAAGLAHIFSHLYQATGEKRFADAARGWIDTVYAHRADGEGVAGFRAWNPDPKAASEWLVEPGLLAGAAGIGAVLAAACTCLPPRWDSMFLLGGAANG